MRNLTKPYTCNFMIMLRNPHHTINKQQQVHCGKEQPPFAQRLSWSTSIIHQFKCTRIVGSIILLLALSSQGVAQTRIPVQPRTYVPRYGIFAGYTSNSHDAQLLYAPETFSCNPGYNGGTGAGFQASALAEFQINHYFFTGIRLAYTQTNAAFRTPESMPALNGNAQFEYRLDTKIATLGIEPLLGLRLYNNFVGFAGIRYAYITSASYTQSENVTSATGAFIDEQGNSKRVRNEFTGTLTKTNPSQVAVLLGASYELLANEKRGVIVAPELWYELGSTNVLSQSIATKWTVNTIRFGVAIKYGASFVDDPEELIKRKRAIDTTTIESPTISYQTIIQGKGAWKYDSLLTTDTLFVTATYTRTDTMYVPPANLPFSATVSATAIKNTGLEMPTDVIATEEFNTSITNPLLPYIFFNENASDIPARYKQITASTAVTFNEQEVNSLNRTEVYYNILNIVGSRMKANPKSKIILTGCNQDVRDEFGKTKLSKERAAAVKKYLMDTWAIEDKRIALQSRSLPQNASNSQTPDGAEENRRVEISTDDTELLAPVISTKVTPVVTPSVLRVKPTVQGRAAVTSWSLTCKQNGVELHKNEGRTTPTAISWNMQTKSGILLQSSQPIQVQLEVNNAEGKTATDSLDIPTESVSIARKKSENRQEKQLTLTSLLFPDNKETEVSEYHKTTIASVKSQITTQSVVTINGYTDRVGSAQTNKELSQERAISTAKALGITTGTIQGIGAGDLYNANLPEGRFYSRCVEVKVETPVK